VTVAEPEAEPEAEPLPDVVAEAEADAFTVMSRLLSCVVGWSFTPCFHSWQTS
jgi:hypothetical protein